MTHNVHSHVQEHCGGTTCAIGCLHALVNMTKGLAPITQPSDVRGETVGLTCELRSAWLQ